MFIFYLVNKKLHFSDTRADGALYQTKCKDVRMYNGMKIPQSGQSFGLEVAGMQLPIAVYGTGMLIFITRQYMSSCSQLIKGTSIPPRELSDTLIKNVKNNK